MKLMNHESDLVRKKLVCALHRVYQLDKATILDAHLDKLRKALCDKGNNNYY